MMKPWMDGCQAYASLSTPGGEDQATKSLLGTGKTGDGGNDDYETMIKPLMDGCQAYASLSTPGGGDQATKRLLGTGKTEDGGSTDDLWCVVCS